MGALRRHSLRISTLPDGLAVDATGVYFADSGLNIVGRVPLGGASTFTTLATFQPLPSQRPWLVLSQGTLYWRNWDASKMAGSIQSLPVAGGTPNTVVEPESLAAMGSTIVGPRATATTLYWADTSGFLESMPLWGALGGGPVIPLDVGGVSGWQSTFAVGPTAVAWSTDYGNLNARLLTGGLVATFGVQSTWDIVVDEANVYWTLWTDGIADGGVELGSVMKAPVSGGSVTTIACDQNWPTMMAEDATNVYWINESRSYGTGSVMKIAK